MVENNPWSFNKASVKIHDWIYSVIVETCILINTAVAIPAVVYPTTLQHFSLPFSKKEIPILNEGMLIFTLPPVFISRGSQFNLCTIIQDLICEILHLQTSTAALLSRNSVPITLNNPQNRQTDNFQNKKNMTIQNKSGSNENFISRCRTLSKNLST